jgi:DNA-directed RNA polymerase subunit RPC12/RpoP
MDKRNRTMRGQRLYRCQDCGNDMFIRSYLINSGRRTGVPVCTGCGGRFWDVVSRAGKEEKADKVHLASLVHQSPTGKRKILRRDELIFPHEEAE